MQNTPLPTTPVQSCSGSPMPTRRRKLRPVVDGNGRVVEPPSGMDDDQLLEWAVEQAAAERHRQGKAEKVKFTKSADGDADIKRDEQLSQMLDKLNTLIEDKEGNEAARIASEEKMMLLRPGRVYKADELPTDGFRVMGGYDLKTNRNGDFMVSREKYDSSLSGTYSVIRLNYEDGLSWCYWDFSICNEDLEDLRECCIKYGMGGWHDMDKDLRCKGVYMNEKRSAAPGDFFIIAMDIPSTGTQVGVLQNENRETTQRIYRSAMPDEFEKLTRVREAINMRHGADVIGWWNM